MKPLTFVRMCKIGIAKPIDIDLFIDVWHDSDVGGELYEYLGMTREQYNWGYTIQMQLTKLLLSINYECS